MSKETNQSNQAKPSTTDFRGNDSFRKVRVPALQGKAGNDPIQPHNRGDQGTK